MTFSSRLLLATICLSLGVLAFPDGPPSLENILEECKPRKHEEGQQREVCCHLPRPPEALREERRSAMKNCREAFGIPTPGPPPPDPRPPSWQSPQNPPGPPTNRICLDECFFNKSGLLMNGAVVMNRTLEELGGDPVWRSVVEDAAAKCLASASSEVPPEGKCKSGAYEYNKCLMRVMYFNCPSGFKSDSESCSMERARMERCPNLRPYLPHPPRSRFNRGIFKLLY